MWNEFVTHGAFKCPGQLWRKYIQQFFNRVYCTCVESSAASSSLQECLLRVLSPLQTHSLWDHSSVIGGNNRGARKNLQNAFSKGKMIDWSSLAGAI